MNVSLDAEVLTEHGLSSQEADRIVAEAGKIDPSLSPASRWRQITEVILSPDHPFEVHRYVHETALSDWSAGPAPAWFPENTESTNIASLMRAAGTETYGDLYQWSIRNRKKFWDTMIKKIGVRFRNPYADALDLSEGPEHPRWLSGAKLNIVDSCFNAPEDSAAIVYQNEQGTLARVSVGELRSLVFRVANGLADLGLHRGDLIAIDMPMTVEAAAIFLGAVAAGCIVVTIADSFAPHEIEVRLGLARVRCIFTQDVILRSGKRIPLYEKVIAANAPKAIVLAQSGSLNLQLKNGDIAWSDFLSDDESFDPLPGDPSDTTCVLFSSGTTAQPKAIPWDNTTPIKSAIDGHLHHDIHPGDVVCWPTNLGWMMGPWLLYATLVNRATVALYYDSPTTPEFCTFVQDAGVTMLGLVPSIVSAWKQGDCVRGIDWSAIRAFSSTGECSNPADMLYLMSQAGYKPVIEYCGGTEIGGGYLTGTVVQPSVPGLFSTPALGSEIVILDENGAPAPTGEVFLVPPSMGLSSILLNRNHHDVYYEGTPKGPSGESLRRHGDRIQSFSNGYFRAHGRIDDTMNLGGVKVSTLEIEEVTSVVPGIRESVAIAVPPPGGGPLRLIIYAVPSGEIDAVADAELLKTTMQREIRNRVNPLFKIHRVVIVDEVPRTASNKIMRRLLRDEYLRREAE